MDHIHYHPSWIEIDTDQLKKNITIIREYIGESLYCLPVKANAYGHGLEIVAHIAQEMQIDYLAVACLQEGIALRKSGIKLPIIVFGAFHENQVEDLINFNLEFTISSMLKARWVKEKCEKLQRTCCVHLEVDTGIQRTGVRPETALSIYEYLSQHSCFRVVGIYSHFASSDLPEDPFAKIQIQKFNALKENSLFQNQKILWHLANSGGTAYYPESHYDMVRPSFLTFGYLMDEIPEKLKGIAPCFSLKSQISFFKVVEEGEGISYDHTYVTKEKTRVITIPVGYGDGYLRKLSNQGQVLIRGKRYPIVGTICMDQFMVDIGNDEAFVGEEVILIGRQGKEEISALEIAERTQSNPREVLTLLNDRLPRKSMELQEVHTETIRGR